MRLRDYFEGIPVHLHVQASSQVVADRINGAAGSTFWPFNTGVVGGVWLGRVRLRFRSSFAEYNAKPVLAGIIRDTSTGSELFLSYRAPAFSYLFFPFWYLILGFFAVLFLFGQTEPPSSAGDNAMLIFILGLMFIAPLAMHYFGTRNADDELSQLLDFLAVEAGAQPLGLQPPHSRQS